MMSTLQEQAAKLAAMQSDNSGGSKQAPEENGERLAAIQRGKDEQLRVNWSEYNGKHFVNLRVWKDDGNGGWWPQKDKGLTVRVHELPDFAGAISRAVDMAIAASDA